MKKFITLMIALTAISAYARMPERAKEMMTTKSVVIFYDAMDQFDAQFPDAISDMEYSCNPDGAIYFGRRITGKVDFPPLHSEKEIRPAFEAIRQATDSAYNLRGREYVNYRASGSWDMQENRETMHAGAYRSSPDKPVAEFSEKDAIASFNHQPDYTESAGHIVDFKTGDYSIMQEIILPSAHPASAPDMTAILQFFKRLPSQGSGRASKKTSGKEWEKTYALFLDRMWTGEALIINYSRANRTIILTDLITRRTYTATYMHGILSMTIR